MSGLLVGALALLVLWVTALLVTAVLRIQGTSRVLLAAYTVMFGEIVGLALFLSSFRGLTRLNLVVGVIAVLVAAASVWVLAGLPRVALLPNRRPRRPGRGPILVLGTVVALALVYVVALILGTPPNGWDPLNYHLARAAFWLQSRHIGYIEPTYDERLNLNPPDGEIVSAFVLGVTHDEVFVGFVQFFAALACAAGVYALARRVGLTRAEAAFGSLLFLSLPIVLLQASLAKNDLVVGSVLLSAAVFALGESRGDVALVALATALAVGTKSTALYGVVLLLVLGLFLSRRGRRLAMLTAIVGGTVAGSYWYAVNAAESGHLLGDQSAQRAVTAPLEGAENLVTSYGMLVDTLDISGAQGRDILLYGLAALLLAGWLFLGDSRLARKSALAAGAVVASPFLLLLLSEHVGGPSLVRLYEALGKPDGYIGDVSPTIASDTASWFGPVGLVCAAGAIVVTAVLYRQRSVRPLIGALTLAPLAWFVLVAVTLTYNPWLGRFFIFPVALSAAVWGMTLRSSAASWSAAVLAALTIVLTLVHYAEKPSGLRLLDRASVRSVWTMKRSEVQSQHEPPLAPLLAFLDEKVPAKASVALALGDNDFGYPAFGPHLERHVEVVPFGSNARDTHADWLVANAERAPEIDASCWRIALQSSEGSVFTRSASCA